MTESKRYRQQMKDLGLCSGDVVMVHSSMKAMQTKRTPEEIIGDIEAVIGGAKAFLIDLRALLAAALLKMRADPYAFVTDISMWI